MILVIDNYDSFTFNLVQALQAAAANVRVVRNDEIDADDLAAMADDPADPLRGILISPGPGDPSTAGVSNDAVRIAVERELPLLGVCLGMQSLAAVFGASVVRAPTLVHGESSQVTHDAKGYLRGMPLPFPAARYHSLCVDATTLPPELYVSALADDAVVMGIRHRTLPIEGVQFHPESVLTPDGPRILARFLRQCEEGQPEVLENRRDFCFKGLAA
jgi:para-aminobenzoate synthetase component II